MLQSMLGEASLVGICTRLKEMNWRLFSLVALGSEALLDLRWWAPHSLSVPRLLKNLLQKTRMRETNFPRRAETLMDDDIILSAPDLGAIELQCEIWGEPVDKKIEEDEDDES